MNIHSLWQRRRAARRGLAAAPAALSATLVLIGPGHQSLLQVGDVTWMAYHAWEVTAQGTLGDRRFMDLDRVDWSGPRPTVGGPTMVP